MRDVQRQVPLAPVPESIGIARSTVRAVVAGMDVRVAGDVELLTSELVTNAIRHGGSQIDLEVVLAANCLTVTVHDDGEALPQVGDREVPMEAVSGRGLQLVAQVADSWGVAQVPDRAGKRVWFTMAVDDARSPGPTPLESARTT
ncbi:ATP-binding protein [Mumia zhuanghuii]|uniref:ATP-binding protein n=2 Tax=Mumia TaxID=1546255 RepID=A0ABW1QJU5_9ACTN|nr:MULTISPECIES: ATP-binding protein [Mumia]KAA1419742.1 ATP-binding protein [Mumia zhuanghuii]